MYTEEYENRGFPIRDFLLKLILVVIIILLLIWLIPKFLSPKEINEKDKTNNSTSQIFKNNIKKMEKVAILYYDEENIPKETGKTTKLTLKEMIDNNLISKLKDKNKKECDINNSYVELSKYNEDYILKINLKDSETEDYVLKHLGKYDYCNTYLCEKKGVEINKKSSKPKSTKSNTEDKKEETTSENKTSTTPTKKFGHIYEYQKVTDTKLSNWSSWSDWSKVSCNNQAINCDDKDENCLKKVEIETRNEITGTQPKTYTKTRKILKQTGVYNAKACSNYNYIKINVALYATKSTYTSINNITEHTKNTIGDWKYIGKLSYSTPPRDKVKKFFIFAGADYSTCGDYCNNNPNYYYDVYEYTGDLMIVNSTTSTPEIPTTSSTISKANKICGTYITKEIPIYETIDTTEQASRTETLSTTTCYERTQTRAVLSKAKVSKKWSKYNDKKLLNKGWTYTGSSKKSK